MSKDRIVYTIEYSGVDGRDKPKIVHASFSATEQEHYFKNSNNSLYLSKNKRIVEVEEAKRQALGKLDALDKLLLGIEAE